MRAFGSNFPNFRAIWLGTTKPQLQNRYGAADQNIQTFISNLGYLWLTTTSWIDSAPSEPSNSSQSGHTCTNVASFRQNEITKMTPNSAPTDFANFGRRYFHFQLAPSNKLGCYGLGMTSATIGDIVHGVKEDINHIVLYERWFCRDN